MNLSELANWATDSSSIDDAILVHQLIRRVDAAGIWRRNIWLRPSHKANAGVLAERVWAERIYFETGGSTFSNERNNRNHIRLGYSAISQSLIAWGIGRIARGVRAQGGW